MVLSQFERIAEDDLEKLQDRLEAFTKQLVDNTITDYVLSENLDCNGFDLLNAGNITTGGGLTTGTVYAIGRASALTSGPTLGGSSTLLNCTAVAKPSTGKYNFTVSTLPSTGLSVFVNITGQQSSFFLPAGYITDTTTVTVEFVNSSATLADVPDGRTVHVMVMGP